MARRTLRIGFLGPVLESSSRHAQSISRAIAIAQNELPALVDGHAELVVKDDGATAQGGKAAVQLLLADPIDAVAGLFSSSSAAAAIPLLAAQGIGVVIAGANADQLTESSRVYRVCDTASCYAAWIARILEHLSAREIAIHFEPTEFGQSIGQKLLAARGAVAGASGRVIACIGQFDFADQVLRAASPSLQPGDVILLTDDCQSDHKIRSIANNFRGVEILVAGFSVHPSPGRSWAREAAYHGWGEEPAAFFHETIAAIEAAIQLAEQGNLNRGVATVTGNLVFDRNGEAQPERMALYRWTTSGLRECGLDLVGAGE